MISSDEALALEAAHEVRPGGHSHLRRHAAQFQDRVLDLEAPPLDSAIDEALQDFVARRKQGLPDAVR